MADHGGGLVIAIKKTADRKMNEEIRDMESEHNDDEVSDDMKEAYEKGEAMLQKVWDMIKEDKKEEAKEAFEELEALVQSFL